MENLTEHNTVHLSDNRILGSRGRADVDLPTRLGIGDTIIEAVVIEEVIDPRLLDILVCPVTRAELTYDPVRQELVSRAARLAYPIRDGVPIMLPEEARKLDDLGPLSFSLREKVAARSVAG